jgi:uncharacterized protein YkwD
MGKRMAAVAVATTVVSSLVLSVVVPAPVVAVSPAAAPSATAMSTARTPVWLQVVNRARADAGLSGVREQRAWSKGARSHAIYAVRNQLFDHNEDPRLPFHTPAGQAATRTGNLAGSDGGGFAPSAVEGWLESPGHALWMLYPRLTRAGYGDFFVADPPAINGGRLAWVAVLPALDGIDFQASLPNWTYPAKGATVARNPQTLYVGFAAADYWAAEGPTCPCTVRVTVNGRKVAAWPQRSPIHKYAMPIRLAKPVPSNASVSVRFTSRGPNGATRARSWDFRTAKAARAAAGAVESVTKVPGKRQLRVSGWAVDRDNMPNPPRIDTFVDWNIRSSRPTNVVRSDVRARFGRATGANGFNTVISLPQGATGEVDVCVRAVSQRGVERRLACRTITV